MNSQIKISFSPKCEFVNIKGKKIKEKIYMEALFLDAEKFQLSIKLNINDEYVLYQMTENQTGILYGIMQLNTKKKGK